METQESGHGGHGGGGSAPIRLRTLCAMPLTLFLRAVGSESLHMVLGISTPGILLRIIEVFSHPSPLPPSCAVRIRVHVCEQCPVLLISSVSTPFFAPAATRMVVLITPKTPGNTPTEGGAAQASPTPLQATLRGY